MLGVISQIICTRLSSFCCVAVFIGLHLCKTLNTSRNIIRPHERRYAAYFPVDERSTQHAPSASTQYRLLTDVFGTRKQTHCTAFFSNYSFIILKRLQWPVSTRSTAFLSNFRFACCNRIAWQTPVCVPQPHYLPSNEILVDQPVIAVHRKTLSVQSPMTQ